MSVPPSALGLFCFACELLFRAATAAQRPRLDIFRNHVCPNPTCCSWFPAPVLSLPRVCVKVYPEVPCWAWLQGPFFSMTHNLVALEKGNLSSQPGVVAASTAEVVPVSLSLCSLDFPSVLPPSMLLLRMCQAQS